MTRADKLETQDHGPALALSSGEKYWSHPGPLALVVALGMIGMILVPTATGTSLLPLLPQATVNMTMPTQTGAVRKVNAGDSKGFQNAINASTCGDTIVLVAGSTYSGNFTIPSTSCSGWIVVESSALASLPSSGTRVGPSNVSNMATISTPTVSPAILFLPSSNHWRFIGLEVTTSYVSTTNTVYNLVLSGTLADAITSISVRSQLPAQLIFDRIYIHGLSNTNTTRGIEMDSQGLAIVDSYCDEIHSNFNDSQCFLSFNGVGPYLIQNNFIQAAGENIAFGGADPAIPNLVPSDITIIGNVIQKNVTWRSESAPYNWEIKNLFELKNAQRVLLDGNVLQYTWSAGQDEAIIWRAVDQGSTCTWCIVADITGTHNLIQHAPMALVLAPNQSGEQTVAGTMRILFQNNLMTDISAANWGGSGQLIQISTDVAFNGLMHDINIDHNTGFDDRAPFQLGGDDGGTINNVQITNNIWDYGVGNLGSTNCCGTLALTTWVTNYVYNDNVQLNASGMNNTGQSYPFGAYWNRLAATDFTSYSGRDPDLSGNFQLTSSSPYYQAGTDGKDVGVWDWTCLNNDSAAALAGTFVPSPGCALSGNLRPQPPINLNVIVQ